MDINNNIDTFQKRLRLLRESNDLTIEQVAVDLNTSVDRLKELEVNANPDINEINRISNYFNVSLEFLLNNNVSNANDETVLHNIEDYLLKCEEENRRKLMDNIKMPIIESLHIDYNDFDSLFMIIDSKAEPIFENIFIRDDIDLLYKIKEQYHLISSNGSYFDIVDFKSIKKNDPIFYSDVISALRDINKKEDKLCRLLDSLNVLNGDLIYHEIILLIGLGAYFKKLELVNTEVFTDLHGNFRYVKDSTKTYFFYNLSYDHLITNNDLEEANKKIKELSDTLYKLQ